MRAQVWLTWATGLAAGVLAAGCAPIDRESVVGEVLQADPGFSEVIEKHQDLRRRIETYERELSLKRSTVNQTIKQLRQDLASSAATVRAKTEETRAKMDPDRKRLVQALTEGAALLKAKQLERAVISRSMIRLRKSQEAARQGAGGAAGGPAADLAGISADAARVDHEIAGLKDHVRLIKLKLLITKI
jgi:hypothetical protein